ncbi:HutD family protein [Colwellia psychrerythraea]|uniref:HutD-family protein n=1 Tax=Colwellia psychrerythraea TaxID=28229 RepID=A0A099L394_COLPS|nr:HutD family protein [Colwellia psychrerythraea]KGJ97434.1 HutD-family protein [Colwellia psychrerythraea]
MLTILSPEKFKTIPWKNGLGHTTELAISEGGSLDSFDWRLSIASVVNDGDFSNFAGYQRNLVLIEGEGLTLDHRNGDIDNLTNLLDIAHFDGGCNTHGALVNGGIKDFNIMTKQASFSAEVNCYVEQQKVIINLSTDSLVFAYSLSDEMMINTSDNEVGKVPVAHLAKLHVNQSAKGTERLNAAVTGKNILIIELEPKKTINFLMTS